LTSLTDASAAARPQAAASSRPARRREVVMR
jgi:hypothetical protein